ncbi:MAG: type II secretion system protein [Ignavibacteriales bacterium]|nr:MAG: type II secretion system protein [Ignavibacteriales bacterium]
MDLLNNENGSTILEALVVIVLIGILAVMTTSIFNIVLNNPVSIKQEALNFAYQEMNRVISQSAMTDSVYTNDKGNMIVQRNITELDSNLIVEISVKKSYSDSTIVSLKSVYKK